MMRQLQAWQQEKLQPWTPPYGTPVETEETLSNGLLLTVHDYTAVAYGGIVGVAFQGQLIADVYKRGPILQAPLSALKKLLEQLPASEIQRATPELLATLRLPLSNFLELSDDRRPPGPTALSSDPLERCFACLLQPGKLRVVPPEKQQQEAAKLFLARFPPSTITTWERLRVYLMPASLLRGWESVPYITLLADPTSYLKLKEAAWSEVVACLKLLQEAGEVEEGSVVFPLHNRGYRSFILSLKPQELALLLKPLEELACAPLAVQTAQGEYLKAQLQPQESHEDRLTPAEQAATVVRWVMEEEAAKRPPILPLQAKDTLRKDILTASRFLEALKDAPTALEVISAHLRSGGRLEPLGGTLVLRVLFYRGVPEGKAVEPKKLRCCYDWLRDPSDAEFILGSLRARGLSPETILRLIHKIAFSEKVFTTLDWLNLIAQWQEDFMDYPGDWLADLFKGERKLLKPEVQS